MGAERHLEKGPLTPQLCVTAGAAWPSAGRGQDRTTPLTYTGSQILEGPGRPPRHKHNLTHKFWGVTEPLKPPNTPDPDP